jgi:curved DNA-binding protein CbpA
MRVRNERDYYAILGVQATATDEEMKRAYRRLALRYHPDRNPGDPRAEERFKEVSEAYAVLMDPTRRREYDRLRGERARGSRPRAPRWREEELFRDLFRDPRAASIFEELTREWTRMGYRGNEAFLRDVFFRGRAVVVIGPGGIRWVGSFGGRAPAERADGSPSAGGAEWAPSLPGFLGWLWGRLKETAGAPGRLVRQLLGISEGGGGSRRGDLVYEIALGSEDLGQGGRYRVTLRRPGRTEELLVRVPPGLRPGTRLRLRGRGEPGTDGTPGDLFLVVRARA